MIEEIGARFPYWMMGILLAIGLYGMIIKRDLIKKVIGMVIFQAVIVVFFINGSIREGGTVPVLLSNGADPELYMNPLPQVLMLTAIVVTVALIGVALAFLVKIYREFGELDEEYLLKQVRS